MNKKHEISNEEWENCKNYFNYRCAYCGLPVEEHYRMWYGKMRQFDLHREHVDHEGLNDLSNCVPACTSCNSSKWKHNLGDWYNDDNENFSQERLYRIYKWLNQD
ncbi:HNH endonuclease, partial [Butyricicoccus sp. 1XD8-22]